MLCHGVSLQGEPGTNRSTGHQKTPDHRSGTGAVEPRGYSDITKNHSEPMATTAHALAMCSRAVMPHHAGLMGGRLRSVARSSRRIATHPPGHTPSQPVRVPCTPRTLPTGPLPHLFQRTGQG